MRVRLKLGLRYIWGGISGCFNPTRVRLKSLPKASGDTSQVLQPHKGSAETSPQQKKCMTARGFNLTRVRLKPGAGLSTVRGGAGFDPTRVRLKHV